MGDNTKVEKMKEIKRYDEDIKESNLYSSECWAVMIEEAKGQYVKYTDHKSVVETMQKRIDKLEAEPQEPVKSFEFSYDKFNIDTSDMEEIKMFKAVSMSTSNNHTCFDSMGNDYHTRECLTLSKYLTEQITKQSKGL